MPGRGLQSLLALLVGAAAVLVTPSVPAVAAVAPASTVHGDKPVPVPPPDAYRPGAGPRVVPKPAYPGGAAPKAPLAWSLTLTASPTILWPTQYAGLTATVNQDVGPTPYWISIYEDATGSPIAVCGAGTTCAVSITKSTPTWASYQAVVATGHGVYPPAGEVAWDSASVNWKGLTISLAASNTTLPVGTSTTLTATTSEDILTSPFFTEIWDTTTGARLGICLVGTTCTATVSQSAATTHRYVAVQAGSSNSFPPPTAQESSPPAWVTWSSSGWAVSLAAASATTVTATANQDVDPTPYYIEIFAEQHGLNGAQTTGYRLALCASGTACTTAAPAGVYVVAFVSSADTAIPPAATQASSPVIPSPTVIT